MKKSKLSFHIEKLFLKLEQWHVIGAHEKQFIMEFELIDAKSYLLVLLRWIKDWT